MKKRNLFPSNPTPSPSHAISASEALALRLIQQLNKAVELLETALTFKRSVDSSVTPFWTPSSADGAGTQQATTVPSQPLSRRKMAFFSSQLTPAESSSDSAEVLKNPDDHLFSKA